jgi:hypothetical protein
MFTVFFRRSAPPIRPATSEADVRDLPLSRVSFPPSDGLPIRLTDLRYFFSQLCDTFFEGILHDDRLAGHAELGSADCLVTPRKVVGMISNRGRCLRPNQDALRLS